MVPTDKKEVLVVALLDPITARAKRETFVKLLFGKGSGYVCVALLSAGTRKMNEHYFKFPSELGHMLDVIEVNTNGNNVYICPQLFTERKRTKGSVAATPNVWADLDDCSPELMAVEPTITVQSSPGRYQAYWRVDDVDPDDAQALSKRIAYAHAPEGADKSGWDLTQLLRVPYTYNYKYQSGSGLPVVEIMSASTKVYTLDDFEIYPTLEGYTSVDIPVPSAAELPQATAEELLQQRRLRINLMVWQLFQDEPLIDWSKSLWQLQMLLFEAGFNREETFVICKAAKCNKYSRDGKPDVLLWKEVCRSAVRAEQNAKLLTTGSLEEVQLLSEEETNRVESAPATFIERYQTWAKALGDAAPQYHLAGAFVILTSILSGAVSLPTSFGRITPNLWFMILADTTLTRKSTAMDLAMDLLEKIDDGALLATDGSLEGMLTALATRADRPSVFFRDEFSGLLEAITKKDYMAGMAEMLTKLYDGKTMKRLLRKEVIEVRNPILVLFAGGIKEKICSMLTYENVSSGFMPRFIFFTAESDPSKLQPLGPPTEESDNGKGVILEELQGLADHYHQSIMTELPKVVGAKVAMQRKWDATLTPEAWARYNQLEMGMVEDGLKSERPDIMTPVNDRLSKSMLKAAVLIAASRTLAERVVVEEIDILRAIYYGQQWKMHANIVMMSVGKGTLEKQIDTVSRLAEKTPGVTRSAIMQWMHLTAQQANALFDTMDQRGLIIRRKEGRTERLWPLATPGRKKVD